MKKKSLQSLLLLTGLVQASLIVLELIFSKDSIANLYDEIVIIMTAISVLFTILFSYVIFLKELHKNRNYDLSKQIFWLKILVVFFLVGLVIIIISNKLYISVIFYIFISLIYMIYIITKVLLVICKNENAHFIEELLNEINKYIKTNEKPNSVKINEYLDKINKYYNIEYLNNNINTCILIIKNYSKFLQEGFKKDFENILDKNGDFNSIFETIILFYEKLIKKDNNDLSITLNNQIIYEICKFCKVLIECDCTKKLEVVLDVFENIVIHNSQYIILDDAFSGIYSVLGFSYKNKNYDIFKIINKKNIDIFKYFSIQNNDDFKLVYKYILSALTGLIDDYDDYFKIIFSELEYFIFSKVISNDIRYMISCFANILESKLYELNKVKNEYYNLIIKIVADKKFSQNELFINWIIFYIDKCKIEDVDKINVLKNKICKTSLDNNSNISNYLIPDYVAVSKKNLNQDSVNIGNANELQSLLYKAFTAKKRISFNNILHKLSEIIYSYDKNNIREQKIWMNVYFNLFEDKLFMNDFEFIEITVINLRKTIIELNNQNKISKNFASFIINTIYNIGDKYIIYNDRITSIFIQLFQDLMDKDKNLNFIYVNSDIEEMMYEKLFYLGVYAIESGNEKILKEISNSLGWKIKEKIDKKQSVIAYTILDYAISLYKLSYQNKLSEQAIVFVGTLFIIIGGYSFTNQMYHQYAKRIKDNLGKNEYKELLLNSKDLRSYKSKEWDSLLHKNIKSYFEKFWNFLFERSC